MLTAYAANANASEVAGETASQLAQLIQLFLGKIPSYIAAFIVILLSFLVAKIGRRIVEGKLSEHIEEEHQELQILGGRLTYSIILVLGLTVGLKIAGIDLTTIIAAVAFGIGFALKDMIMNFLAGIMILVGRHFTIDDFIKVGSTIGRVVAIQSRVTVLQAIDGTKVIVPNAELFKKQVVSFTSNPFRRIEVKVDVDYRSNLENVLKVCMKAIKNTKGVLLEPKPAVLVDNFGESGISIKIKAWVESRSGWVKIKSQLAHNVKKDFDQYGITIPWPIRTIVKDEDNKIEEKMLEEQGGSEAEAPSEEQPKVETPQDAPQEQQAPQAPAPQSSQPPQDEQPLKPIGEI